MAVDAGRGGLLVMGDQGSKVFSMMSVRATLPSPVEVFLATGEAN
jgi:hypothetical protein